MQKEKFIQNVRPEEGILFGGDKYYFVVKKW